MENYYFSLLTKILSGEATTEEAKVFEQWLTESDENVKLYRQLREYWEKTGEAYQNYEPNTENAWNRFRASISRKGNTTADGRRSLRFVWLKAAASILLVLGLGFSTVWLKQNTNLLTYGSIEYHTVDSVKVVTLPDESLVTLNKNSYLKVPRVFRGKYRRVLLKGEAFFEVERNVDNPFVVNTNETLTKVLGTSFNIEGEDARVKVYVNTGKVAFWHKKDKKSRVYLGAGDQGVFNKQKHTLRKLHADDKNIIAWKTGKVFFDNTPLIEVLNILEEHYDVKFKYQQEALKTIALTAKFDQAPLGEVIEIIEFSLDIKITRIKDDKYLVSTN